MRSLLSEVRLVNGYALRECATANAHRASLERLGQEIGARLDAAAAPTSCVGGADMMTWERAGVTMPYPSATSAGMGWIWSVVCQHQEGASECVEVGRRRRARTSSTTRRRLCRNRSPGSGWCVNGNLDRRKGGWRQRRKPLLGAPKSYSYHHRFSPIRPIR